MSTTILCTVATVAFIIYAGVRLLLRRVYSVLHNIPGPPRKSFVSGNLTQHFNPDDWEFQEDLEQNYGQVVKVNGLLGDPQLLVFDPAALNSILVKDFAKYEEIDYFMSLNTLLFGDGIFSSAGNAHRRYRRIMLPAFSKANLRKMVPFCYEVAEKMRELVGSRVVHAPQTVAIDLNSILTRGALELIGRIGIGPSANLSTRWWPEKSRPTDTFTDLHCSPTVFRLALVIPFLPLIRMIVPFPAFLRFTIDVVPSAVLRETRDIVDCMWDTAAGFVRGRKATLKDGTPDADDTGKDIMSILMKSNTRAHSAAAHLTDEELIAATSMLFFAATDTTSSALDRIVHTLAMHLDVQEMLRKEVLAAPEHMDYEGLMGLPYLDAVVREVLRLHPPASPVMYREALVDAVLPLSTPLTGVDGTVMHSVNAPKGTTILIGIAAANHSTQIWGGDARDFNPARWLKADTHAVSANTCGVYANTLTFLGGPKSCIGVNLALLEIKVVVCVLLRAFRFAQPDARVKWRMTGIIPSPYVDGQRRLPILVERLKA
ncbi:cytochrome P450 [Mycena pura]|uniref:Cytochrome P450 n=1 Tax=Mycena pura TaxID=153505 RepID=A0AAD6V4C0_9AGAR|nr:cytochrome P450 [Mycena pura]